MKNNKLFCITKYLLLVYLLLTVVYPILKLFFNIRTENIKAVLKSYQFVPMLINSLVTTLSATVISVLLAFGLAFILYRSRVKFKSVWAVLFTMPMLIPSISHGVGLILLFGDNGIITNLLGLDIGIYGYTGIILGSVLYSFPPAFLMFYDSFQYEDFTVYESARVLGLSKSQQFLKITLPGMRGTIVSAVLAVFTMVFTDYGVPLMTGGKVMTLPVYMYREVLGMMNFSNGAVIGLILLLPAVIAFLLDFKRNNNSDSSNAVNGYLYIEENKKRDIFAYLILGIVFLLLCLPVLGFIALSFFKQYPIDMTLTLDHVRKLFSNNIGMYLVNSLAVALATALLGTCIAYFSAYITSRGKSDIINKIMHFISILPLAIPGVVLGLAFVLSFNKLPLYSTIIILIIVNIVHFFSSPYLMAYNSLSKFSKDFEDVSSSLGINKIRMLADVYIPVTVPTIIEMYSYFFVNSMITISAVSFLVSFRTKTLPLMISQFETNIFTEGTALISLMILAINLIEKIIAFAVKKYQKANS